MIETLIKFTEAANKYGLTVLMEEYDSSDAPFSTSQGLRDYLDPVPDLFCTFDTGNFIYNDEDVFQAYELFRDKICHVHLKDRTVERIYDQDQGKNSADGTKVFYPAPVGEGMLNLEDIVKRLKQDGYDGIYTIEHYGASRQKEFLRKSSKWIDRNFDIL